MQRRNWMKMRLLVIGMVLLVVFIGEAVREAFDPREYSRLR